MWRLNGNTVRVLYVSIVIGIVVVALLSYIIVRDMAENAATGVKYDGDVYEVNETGPFCPGDVLTYAVVFERDRIAPLDIRRHYCNVASGICLLELTQLDHTTVYDLRPPAVSPRTLLIPNSPRMIPGDWVYVHQIAVANTDHWQTYVVPFTIGSDCEQ